MRLLAIGTIVGLLAAGVALDWPDRPGVEASQPFGSALAAPTGTVNTWYCAGGSGAGGVAEATILLANASKEARTAAVTVLGGGSGPTEAATVEIALEPSSQTPIRLADVLGGAEWTGATVEVDGAGVVAEQILTSAQGGVGRSPCVTRTSDRWIVSNGATRAAVERERFVVMLLNPFPDVAVADIELVADVGRDSIEGLVVPAGRVVAVDITEEVTVASTVAASIEVVSGRVAASWIQVADGPAAGRGTRTAAAVPGPAPVWYLPVAATGGARRDVVAVTNPSAADAAEVDLEIVALQPDLEVRPIEITVRPGRTVLVDLSAQARLDGLGPFGVVARSLTGVPVVASITSVTSLSGTPDQEAAAQEAVAQGAAAREALSAVEGSSATVGADAAARRWLVAAQAPDEAPEGDVGFDDDASSLTILNPSAAGIAEVALSVEGQRVRTVEVAPNRIARIPLAWLGSGRFVVELESSSPVVVGRELVGLTSRSASLAVAVSEPVPIAQIR